MTDRNKRYYNFNSSRQPAAGAIHYPFIKILPTPIVPDSVAIIDAHGTATGTVADMQVENDGNVYSVQEINHTPGFEFVIKFISVPFFKFMRVTGAYDGAVTHTVIIQLYDFVNAVYQTKRAMLHFPNYNLAAGANITDRYETIIENSDNYISGGEVWMRIFHPQAGQPAHDIHIDYASLF